jgi:hypothetical protein
MRSAKGYIHRVGIVSTIFFSRPSMAHRDPASDSDSADALEVNVLRDVAKKSLVDALNSVRPSHHKQWRNYIDFMIGEWCKNAGPRCFNSWTFGSHYGSFTAEGRHYWLYTYLPVPELLAQQHGVDKMFWLEAGPLTATTTNIIYLTRPSIKHVKIMAGACPFLCSRVSMR